MVDDNGCTLEEVQLLIGIKRRTDKHCCCLWHTLPLTRGRVPAGRLDEFVAIGFKSATCKIIHAGNQSSVAFCSMIDD